MKAEHPGHLQPPSPNDTSVALADRLRAETRGEVLFDAASRGRYATDASIYQVMPVGVFVPTDDADVRNAIQIARELKVPLLPRGAGRPDAPYARHVARSAARGSMRRAP